MVLSASAFESSTTGAPTAGDADVTGAGDNVSCANPPCPVPDASSIGGGGVTAAAAGPTDNSQKVACKELNDPICPAETHCCGTARLPPQNGSLQPAKTDLTICVAKAATNWIDPADATSTKYSFSCLTAFAGKLQAAALMTAGLAASYHLA